MGRKTSSRFGNQTQLPGSGFLSRRQSKGIEQGYIFDDFLNKMDDIADPDPSKHYILTGFDGADVKDSARYG